MLKWLWALVAMFAFAAAWQAATPGMLGLWLLVGIVAVVASFAGFVSARVSSVASAQMHRETALLAALEGGADKGKPRRDAGAAAFGGTVAYGSTPDHDHSDRHEPVDHGGADGGSSDGGGGDGGGGGGGD
jgi:uncharacterized membrane protein YgcG